MTLGDIVTELSLDVKTPQQDLGREVEGAYVSDLLSDVIGNAKAGYVWVTMQVHLNIVAVASLKGLAGVILVNGRAPGQETLARAAAEGVVIAVSGLPAYEIAGRLYSLGLRCS
jgi:hypothetical protein